MSSTEQTPRLGRWWHRQDDRIVCDLCPRHCQLKPGQNGFCYVRAATVDGMTLLTDGRSSGFWVDPMEKKPLYHFLPGTPILSFGTAGCNLGCKFCQNWHISKARATDPLQVDASPEAIALAARRSGSRAVAFTYNDPVIFAEYALDVAAACRALDIAAVAVTAGYISEMARAEVLGAMDAANVDLKGFTERFYKQVCSGRLEPVKETIRYLARESTVWVEITTLLIPGENDSEHELHELCAWVREACGPEVPLHFSAYHPDFKMDRPRTPPETLLRARAIAREEGLRYVYIGNVNHREGNSTWCPGCGELLIERSRYMLGRWGLNKNACGKCGRVVPGRFESKPGDWGGKRARMVPEPVSAR